MDTIKLILPSEAYLDQVWAYRQEFVSAGLSMDGTSALHKIDAPEKLWREWLPEILLFADRSTVPEAYAQTTQFLSIRESDNKLVGMIQVRHYFTDYLEKFGGHIGYSVRPSEQRKGYAKEQLRLMLPYCKELGFDRVLISCRDDNEGSRRTILANGGVYESTVHEPKEHRDLERYWIALS